MLLDGLERLLTKISGQNINNMNPYTENMMTLVTSLKDTFKKDEASAAPGVTTTAGGRVTKLKTTSQGVNMVQEHVSGDLLQTASDMDRDKR